jgi:hypothetical protein
MMTSNHFPLPHFEYNAALFLNESAVTMMQRSCFEQAIDTLRDATCIMSQLGGLEEESSTPLHPQIVNTMITQATARLSQPEPCFPSVPVTVVTHQLRPPKAAHLARQESNYTLIRIIETNHGDLLDESKAPELPLAIAVYNLAVANLCSTRPQSKPLSTLDDLQRQRYAFELLILSSKLSRACYEESRDVFVWHRALNLTGLMLQTLVQALESHGQSEHALMFSSSLQYFRGAACQLDSCGIFACTNRVFTAATA